MTKTNNNNNNESKNNDNSDSEKPNCFYCFLGENVVGRQRGDPFIFI